MFEATRDHIRALADEDLVEYVQTGTAMYDAEAVAFARKELDDRKLDAALVASLTDAADVRIQEAEQRAEARALDDATRPISSQEKFVAFAKGALGGVGIVTPVLLMLISPTLGERERIRQRWRYSVYGFLALLACIGLGVLIGRLVDALL